MFVSVGCDVTLLRAMSDRGEPADGEASQAEQQLNAYVNLQSAVSSQFWLQPRETVILYIHDVITATVSFQT